MQIIRLTVGVMITLAAVVTMPSLAQVRAAKDPGPSFACAAEQGPMETTVCASPTLSAADRLMATLYAASRVGAFGAGASNTQVGQRKALQNMQSCTKQRAKTSTADCLKGFYDQRTAELATAVIIRAPDLALPVLRKIDPPFAPVAEAIGLWASEPAETNWAAPIRAAKRARITALLSPMMHLLKTESDDQFARSILGENSDGPAINEIGDVFKLDRHFAAFMSIVGSILPESATGIGRAIPCAAIVHHPKLLAATGAVFGSTMDMTVLGTDCKDTLPPAPALTTLDGRLRKGWPNCDGTIRFAAYRTYQVSLDSARLGITSHAPKTTVPHRRGANAADVAAAHSELAVYYVQYLGRTQQQATAMAADAISALMNTAQECD